MSKAFQIIEIAAAVAVNFIPGLGQVASATLIGSLTVGSILTTVAVANAFALAGQILGSRKTPGVSATTVDRLNASCQPTTPRKMCFGRSAMSTEWRP